MKNDIGFEENTPENTQFKLSTSSQKVNNIEHPIKSEQLIVAEKVYQFETFVAYNTLCGLIRLKV